MPKGTSKTKGKGKVLATKSKGRPKSKAKKSDSLPLAESDPLSPFEVLTVDELKLWSLSALQSFLLVRNKNPDGAHDILAARAFVAWEEDAVVDSQLEHKLRSNSAGYKAKLRINSDILPDPFSLTEGWSGEADKVKWPHLTITDIADYLKERTTSDLYRKLLNEYKLGKAFRYFKSRHVKEVHYHSIGDHIPVAFLSVRVAPTMRTSVPDYQVWAVVEKDSNSPGGRIYNAYCTCPVGLHGSCNHIAGLLFRVEYAVRTGMTSSTSNLCQWNVPTNPKVTKDHPLRLDDYKWKKDHYLSQDLDDDHQASVRQLATVFSPMSKSSEEYVKEDDRVLNDLANLIRPEVPNSCFIQLMDKKKNPKPVVPACPPPLVSMALDVDVSTGSRADQIEQLVKLSTLSDEDRAVVELRTRDQAACDDWQQHRAGRITASNMKRVFTRAATLEADSHADPRPLVKVIMGESGSFSTHATKHGVAMEPHAKIMYTRIMKKTHKKFTVRNSGLVLHKEKQFIAASPDLISSCKCCGEGVVEIKCPWSCKDSIPKADNYSELLSQDGEAVLSRTSSHMFQVQGQMGCVGVDHADYFVYSAHGYHLERIQLDKQMWEGMIKRFDFFWSNYVAPHILTGCLSQDTSAPSDHSYTNTELAAPSDHAYTAMEVTEAPGDQETEGTSEKPGTSVLTKPPGPIVFLCGMCGLDCEENPETFSDRSVECTRCRMWCHFGCVGLAAGTVPAEADSWECDNCV